MTTSKAPWTIRSVNNDTTKTAEILDASGKVIAFFLDYRDAETVVDFYSKTEELKEEIETLEDKIKGLQGEE